MYYVSCCSTCQTFKRAHQMSLRSSHHFQHNLQYVVLILWYFYKDVGSRWDTYLCLEVFQVSIIYFLIALCLNMQALQMQTLRHTA